MFLFEEKHPAEAQRLYALHDAFVPDQGKADTVVGELVRAVCNFHYQWENNGETILEGCNEITRNTACYLWEHGFQQRIEVLEKYEMPIWPYSKEAQKGRLDHTERINKLLLAVLKKCEQMLGKGKNLKNEIDSSEYENDYYRYVTEIIEKREEEARKLEEELAEERCEEEERERQQYEKEESE